MSVFEWLGEAFNPGPTGNIDTNKEPLFENQPKRVWVVLSMLLGLGLLVTCLWWILHSGSKLNLLVFFILYLGLAYIITPKPDTSNVGWLGGLIDHPFRISDDWNRFLVFFYLFLLPGKLMLFAVQTFHKLIKYNF